MQPHCQIMHNFPFRNAEIKLFLWYLNALQVLSLSLFLSLSIPFSLSFSVPLYLPFPLNRKQKKFQIFIINTLCLLFFLCNLTRSFTLSKLWTFRIDQEPMRSYMNVTFVIFEFAYLKIQDLILLLDFRDLLWQWPHLVGSYYLGWMFPITSLLFFFFFTYWRKSFEITFCLSLTIILNLFFVLLILLKGNFFLKRFS